MKIPFAQIDAFATRLFEGNPAAVMPLEEWLSGPDATVRARLLAGFIMGMSVSRELGGGSFNIEPAQCEEMRDRLAPILQSLIDG